MDLIFKPTFQVLPKTGGTISPISPVSSTQDVGNVQAKKQRVKPVLILWQND
jgi:hypothetical protein